jgi:hypothetical protein
MEENHRIKKQKQTTQLVIQSIRRKTDRQKSSQYARRDKTPVMSQYANQPSGSIETAAGAQSMAAEGAPARAEVGIIVCAACAANPPACHGGSGKLMRCEEFGPMCILQSGLGAWYPASGVIVAASMWNSRR